MQTLRRELSFITFRMKKKPNFSQDEQEELNIFSAGNNIFITKSKISPPSHSVQFKAISQRFPSTHLGHQIIAHLH